jgi:phage terminase small subunit
MGKVIDIRAELTKDNPRASSIEIQIYADALRTYNEAAQNVLKNGAICSHPRTGAPIENPYLKIRAQQAAIIGKMARIKSDRVLKLLQKDAESV